MDILTPEKKEAEKLFTLICKPSPIGCGQLRGVPGEWCSGCDRLIVKACQDEP